MLKFCFKEINKMIKELLSFTVLEFKITQLEFAIIACFEQGNYFPEA